MFCTVLYLSDIMIMFVKARCGTDSTNKPGQVMEKKLNGKEYERKRLFRSIFNAIFDEVKAGCR